jgi:hypothetical protein
MKNLIILFILWLIVVLCAFFTAYTAGCTRKNINTIETTKPKPTYTYDSKVDPIQFFKYTVIDAIQMTNNSFILCIKSTTLKPTYAINIVTTIDKTIYILAYAYLDNNNLKYFLFDKKTKNFVEKVPSPQMQILLGKKLNKLYGIQST